jgi:hypothetical protein
MTDDAIERWTSLMSAPWNQTLMAKEYGDALAKELTAARERIAVMEFGYHTIRQYADDPRIRDICDAALGGKKNV